MGLGQDHCVLPIDSPNSEYLREKDVIVSISFCPEGPEPIMQPPTSQNSAEIGSLQIIQNKNFQYQAYISSKFSQDLQLGDSFTSTHFSNIYQVSLVQNRKEK